MPDDGFRLPMAGYAEIVRMIRAYNAQKEPAGPEEVGSTAGINATEISRSNAFLVSVGLIEGGKKKTITSQGKALAHALDYSLETEIRREWRSVVLASDFLEKLLIAVRIRNGMEQSSLQTHIAYSAGQPKNPRVMTGANTVIEILKAAVLLTEQDGKLVAFPDYAEEVDETDVSPPGRDSTPPPDQAGQVPLMYDLPPNLHGVSLQIQIQVTADELDSLGIRLKRFLKELREDGGEPQA